MEVTIELRDPNARGEVEIFATVYGQRMKIGEVEADTLRGLAEGDFRRVLIYGGMKNGGVDIHTITEPKD